MLQDVNALAVLGSDGEIRRDAGRGVAFGAAPLRRCVRELKSRDCGSDCGLPNRCVLGKVSRLILLLNLLRRERELPDGLRRSGSLRGGDSRTRVWTRGCIDR